LLSSQLFHIGVCKASVMHDVDNCSVQDPVGTT